MVTGEPGTAVKVTALLSSANAKKLKISRTISSKSARSTPRAPRSSTSA